MQQSDSLIRTKLRLPSVRQGLVARTVLQTQIVKGLQGPLTLLVAPAGFGKTTLLASCIHDCGMAVAWLSLDRSDNQAGRFLSYVVATLRQADKKIGNEAAQLIAAPQQLASDIVLTSLINDLDSASDEVVLILDDYHFISSQDVHEEMTFLLEHCPHTLHIVISTRSDPPLPIPHLRGRGQILELRAADLRFTEPETTHFLNAVMGLQLDPQAVAVLAERTEGWIAGLQMAALSMHDRKDVPAFIKGFSGTNRYILDYLLEEVLAGQSPEIQHFLLCTSILERLSASLCDRLLANDNDMRPEGNHPSTQLNGRSLSASASILEYLERVNLFLVPLDDERIWYRYHHLFADLLRAQLQKSVGDRGVARLHLRASEWFEENGLPIEAIRYASLASDFERIERLIEQHYLEMMNRGEMSGIRFWMDTLSKDVLYQRPWLCLYEAFSRSWFGQLEEASLLLDKVEASIRSEAPTSDTQAMLGYHAYVKSRVTAMQGDIHRAIELCLTARENIPADKLGLQIEFGITLGYEYLLCGDFSNANKTLFQMIRSAQTVGAVNNPVAACALLARLYILQGSPHEAYDLFQRALQLIPQTGGKYLGAKGLVEVGIAALQCEWNELKAALIRVKQGLDLLPMWGKADDLALAYITLSQIQLALANRSEAQIALEKATQLIQTCGVFSEARTAVHSMQVKLWLIQGDWSAINHWATALEKHLVLHDSFGYEDELTQLTRARVFLAQNKLEEVIRLLSGLEESARTGGRHGRLIEISILQALALHRIGDGKQADEALMQSLTLAEPGGYRRVFLDEGRPMQLLLARQLVHITSSPIRDFTMHLLSQFETQLNNGTRLPENASPNDSLVEPLSQREIEVLHLMALGKTNQAIAQQLIVAPGTIKAHAASIYRKLDVANRTEAVARARELSILP